MFVQHSAKATIDSDGIKRALELYAKDKGMPFDITVTKFWYKKESIKFAYDVKPKATDPLVMTCDGCENRRPCRRVDTPLIKGMMCEACEKNVP